MRWNVSEHISGATRVIFSNIFVPVTYGCGLVLLRRRCSTSGLMDDIIFVHYTKGHKEAG